MVSREIKNVLVTGAAGLVGSHLLSRLKLESGMKVRSVFRSRRPIVDGDNITHIQADLTDFSSCRKIVDGIDYVIMLASQTDRRPKNNEYLIHNLKIHYQMLEASHQANVDHYIWLGSASAYPPSNRPVDEYEMFKGEPADESYAFGATTRYMEKLGYIYAEKVPNPMAVTSLRPTAIYGEHGDFNLDTCHVLPSLIRKVVERRNPIEIWGDGEAKRDFIHAEDVANACYLALYEPNTFRDFNIASGKLQSVNELLSLILSIDSYNDVEVKYSKANGRKPDKIAVNISKAKILLGFEPTISIEDGIERTLTWFRQTYIS